MKYILIIITYSVARKPFDSLTLQSHPDNNLDDEAF